MTAGASRSNDRTTSTSRNRRRNDTSFVRNAINRAIRRETEREIQLQRASQLYAEGDLEEDDTLDSSCPLMDLYIQENLGNAVVKTMTPFSFNEFERLWDLVGVEFTSAWTNYRGPRSTTKPKDILFMCLSVLKDPSTWAKIGTNFE